MCKITECVISIATRRQRTKTFGAINVDTSISLSRHQTCVSSMPPDHWIIPSKLIYLNDHGFQREIRWSNWLHFRSTSLSQQRGLHLPPKLHGFCFLHRQRKPRRLVRRCHLFHVLINDRIGTLWINGYSIGLIISCSKGVNRHRCLLLYFSSIVLLFCCR